MYRASRSSIMVFLYFGGLAATICVASSSAAGAVKKQASPSAGDLSNQEIQVNTPFCDAYAPYRIRRQGSTVEIEPLLTSSTPTDAEVRTFLQAGHSTSEPINLSAGEFVDPGYPLLGDPKRHLFADSSDFIRLYTRLFSSATDGVKPQPLCLKSPTNSSAQQSDQDAVYYLVNVVRWKASGRSYQISSSDWYVFNKSDGQASHRQFPFTFHPYVTGDLRIFGSHAVYFLAVHLAPGPNVTWVPGTKVNRGQTIIPSTPNGHHYTATNDGTTGNSEPSWCAASGCDVVDNGITWMETSQPDTYSDFKSNAQISYKLQVQRVEPANVQDFKALIGIVTGGATTTTTPTPTPARTPQIQVSPQDIASYQAFLAGARDRDYTGLYGAAKLVNLKNLPVQITSTTSAKLSKSTNEPDESVYSYPGFWDQLSTGQSAAPASQRNSKSGSGAGTGVPGSSGSPTPANNQGTPSNGGGASANSGGSGASSAVGAPSGPGCTTTADGGTCTETLKVQNEGLYWWDVSVGVPFNSITKLNYASSTTGQITTQTVSKGTAYGFVVLAPWKEDFLSPPSLGIPHLLVGIPFSGKVFDSPFVGAGETFNLSKVPGIGAKLSKVIPVSIRFYAGLVENKTFGPKPSSGPEPYRWIGKLQYGIEFSIRDVASKLTGKSSSTSSSKKSNSTTSNN